MQCELCKKYDGRHMIEVRSKNFTRNGTYHKQPTRWYHEDCIMKYRRKTPYNPMFMKGE